MLPSSGDTHPVGSAVRGRDDEDVAVGALPVQGLSQGQQARAGNKTKPAHVIRAAGRALGAPELHHLTTPRLPFVGAFGLCAGEGQEKPRANS